jgi:hypothetical protein
MEIRKCGSFWKALWDDRRRTDNGTEEVSREITCLSLGSGGTLAGLSVQFYRRIRAAWSSGERMDASVTKIASMRHSML